MRNAKTVYLLDVIFPPVALEVETGNVETVYSLVAVVYSLVVVAGDMSTRNVKTVYSLIGVVVVVVASRAVAGDVAVDE